MQAKGRLQCWNAEGQELGGSCREGCAGKGQAATLEQQRLTAKGAWWKLPRGMCRQRAGCNPGTAKADGQRAWWKLPRGMCRQRAGCNPGTAKADGQRAWWQLRLECPNNRALCAGKGQAAMLEQQKLTARGLGGSCHEGIGGF